MWRLIIKEIGIKIIADEIGVTYTAVWKLVMKNSFPRREKRYVLKAAVQKYAPERYQQFNTSLNNELIGNS